MPTPDDIENALRTMLPTDLHSSLPYLAQLLADACSGAMPIEAVRSYIVADSMLVSLVPLLAGQSMTVGTATLSFGAGNSITIAGDVVGGNKVMGDEVGRDKIDTGGGDYAGGNIDKSQRVEVSGGSTYGAVVGGNTGTININIYSSSIYRPGSAPPLPALFIGREDDLRDLKARLGVIAGGQASAPIHVLTAMRGWPGVGKTTVAAALAHDPDIAARFSDGVLWTSLGLHPNVLSQLAAWGRTLGVDDLIQCQTIEEASNRLTAILKEKRMLLIVDDAWQVEHVQAFRVGGPECVCLVTTRLYDVASAIAPGKAIYKLNVLSDTNALALLRELAPEVVATHPGECLKLVKALEGLPLALQVAGRLLQSEASYGFGVDDLLADLHMGARLLEAKAPPERGDLANETTPTVAILLQKSTDLLDEEIRECFASLGPFSPKPATFDVQAMAAIWPVIVL